MKLIPIFTVVCFLVVLPVLSSCTSNGDTVVEPKAYDSATLGRWYERYLRSEAEKLKIRGLGVALIDSLGQDSYFCLGDAGKGRKVDEGSVFDIGSTSKLLMPIAVMKLVDQGRMELDAPVARYVPEFTLKSPSGSSTAITIRSLLTHESGLPSDILEGWEPEAPGGRAGTTGKEYRQIVGLLNRTKATREPWMQNSYSNAAFSLLAVAVERASGQDYAEFVRREILLPWGMTDSGFAYDGLDPAGIAQGFSKRKEMPVPYIRDLPAGLFCSSARDMARFARGLLGDQAGAGKVLKPSSIMELWKVQNGGVSFDLDFKIGLTFWRHPIASLGLESTVWHGGDLPPFHAAFCLDPVQGIGVFVAVNSGSLDSAALEPLLVQGMRRQLMIRTGRDPERPMQEGDSPVVSASLEFRNELCGIYQMPSVGVCAVYQKGRDLVFKAPRASAIVVLHRDSTMSLKPLLLGIVPLDTESARHVQMRFVHLDGLPILCMRRVGDSDEDFASAHGEKLRPTTLTPAWRGRLGPWRQAGGKASFALAYNRDSGILSANGGTMALKPINDGEAVTEGYGRNSGEWIEAGQDAEGPWLRYSGMELRRTASAR